MERIREQIRGKGHLLSGLKRLVMAAVLLLCFAGAAVPVYAADDVDINKPSPNAEFEVGKKVTIEVQAKYLRPDFAGIFQYPDNYLYIRITKDKEQVLYTNISYSSLPNFFVTRSTSFTPTEEGEYLIEVCRDLTYVNEAHVDLDPLAFSPEDGVYIYVWKNLSSAAVSGITDAVYSGSELTPGPVVVLDGKTLTAGTDYEITYENNINVGTASYKITGKGFYKGEVTGSFNITGKVIPDNAVSSVSGGVYTGKAMTPEPSVVVDGRTLVKDTDYDRHGNRQFQRYRYKTVQYHKSFSAECQDSDDQ